MPIQTQGNEVPGRAKLLQKAKNQNALQELYLKRKLTQLDETLKLTVLRIDMERLDWLSFYRQLQVCQSDEMSGVSGLLGEWPPAVAPSRISLPPVGDPAKFRCLFTAPNMGLMKDISDRRVSILSAKNSDIKLNFAQSQKMNSNKCKQYTNVQSVVLPTVKFKDYPANDEEKGNETKTVTVDEVLPRLDENSDETSSQLIMPSRPLSKRFSTSLPELQGNNVEKDKKTKESVNNDEEIIKKQGNNCDKTQAKGQTNVETQKLGSTKTIVLLKPPKATHVAVPSISPAPPSSHRKEIDKARIREIMDRVISYEESNNKKANATQINNASVMAEVLENKIKHRRVKKKKPLPYRISEFYQRVEVLTPRYGEKKQFALLIQAAEDDANAATSRANSGKHS